MITEYTEAEDFLMDDTFKQYCEGSSQKCVVFWEKWIAENPDKSKVTKQAKRLYQVLSGNLKAVNEQLSYLDEEMASPVKDRIFGVVNYGIAATLFIIIFAGLFYIQRPRTTNSATSNAFISVRGEKKKITLTDGTVVFLNADSKIELASDFNQSERRVNLKGEAFFDVKHDKLRPFIVATKEYNITVLGTAFNVKSYTDEKSSEVTLVRGVIKLEDHSANKNQVILKAGQKITYQSSHQRDVEVSTKVDTEEKLPKIEIGDLTLINTEIAESAWTENNLIFRNKTFLEMKPILERWFNITIEFKNSEVEKYFYTANFKNEDVLTVLRKLQTVKYFNFRKKGEIFEITSLTK